MAKKKKKKSKDTRGYGTTSSTSSTTPPSSSILQKSSGIKQKPTKNNKPVTTSLPTTKASSSVVTSSSKKVEITSNVHDELISLLSHLQTQTTTTPPSSLQQSTTSSSSANNKQYTSSYTKDNKQFIKKITTLYTTLSSLHFSDDQIEDALISLHLFARENDDVYTMENALDYLCLHYKSVELPPLFTEVHVRDKANEEGGIDTITVINTAGGKKKKKEQTEETQREKEEKEEEEKLFVKMKQKQQSDGRTSKQQQEEEKKQKEKEALEKEKEKQKQWLLSQYQYEQHSSDSEESSSHYSSTTSPSTPSLSPEEHRLQSLQKELNELNKDLSDNGGSNYMMSKYEMKQMKQRQNQLKKLVKGLEQKIQKQKKKKQEEEKLKQEEEQNEEGEEECMFSLFGNKDSDDDDDNAKPVISTPTPLPPTTPPKPSPTYTSLVNSTPHPSTSKLHLSTQLSTAYKEIKDVLPNHWTGKTPKVILQEYIRKQHSSKEEKEVKFTKLEENGCKLIISCEKLIIEDAGPYNSFKVAQEFISTEALHILNGGATSNIYRILPPIFRELWIHWTTQKTRQEQELKLNEEEEFQEKIMGLVQKIADAVTTTTSGGGRVNDEKKKKKNDDDGGVVVEKKKALVQNETEDMILDSWEDDDDNEDKNEHDYENDLKESETVSHSPTQKQQQPQTIKKSPTPQGIKLRQQFQNHTSSQTYQTMLQFRSSLPMHTHRSHLLSTINSNTVTVLCAETGAGKTTQCPQYILEDAYAKGYGDKINIICTQPRRISALTVAERVADEMNVTLGREVGYSIRNESKQSRDTKLTFCTTGVLLRRLQNDDVLEGVSHVVVDEVHERQWQIDFLLIVLRELVYSKKRRRTDLKIILMSATLDSKLFCNFFPGSPFLQIPGRTFPVSQYYLEDLLDATNHIIEEGSRCAIRDDDDDGGYYKRTKNRNDSMGTVWVTGRGGEKHREKISLESGTDLGEVSDEYVGYKMSTRRSMERVDEKVINYDLIEDILHLLLIEPQQNNPITAPPKSSNDKEPQTATTSPNNDGSILIFLPGLGEIRSLSDRLKGSRIFGDANRFQILMMHSTLSPKDQKLAFVKVKEGCKKIILATNIAETSVTIPDVVCVIDSGLVKEVRQNKRSGTSTLVTDWCSLASAKQRSGRAGRVREGICCKLFSSRTANHVMKSQAMPELQRVPLEEVCLGILAAGISNNCMDFLLQAPQPPTEDSVQTALALLEEVGAIEQRSAMVDGTGRIESLTPLGRHLAKIPVHVKLGKMLIFGTLFKCLDKILTVAASLSSKSPFSTHIDDATQAASAHRSFFHPSSDFLTICNVWDAYSHAINKSRSEGRRFCNKYYLNQSALIEIHDARCEFVSLLGQIGFLEGNKLKRDKNEKWSAFNERLRSSKYNINGNNEALLNSVIFAGLYPNVAHGSSSRVVSGNVPPTFSHKKEQVYIHRSSINYNKTKLDSEWIAFYEKFATSKVYLSSTCLVKPFSLILFGRSVSVLHFDRKVVVDDWIELKIAAQTGVLFRELRHEVEFLLKEMIEGVHSSGSVAGENGERMINGLVKLMTSE